MFDRYSIGRTVGVGAWLTAIVLLGAPGRSEARENPVCVAAYKKGQQLWKSGHLHQAKETLQRCTKLICSAGLRKECNFRVEQLEHDTPSVVLEVVDDRGRPVTNVNVLLDGKPLVAQLDGRAVPIDPGPHEFVFETAGVVFAKEKAIILQGQRNRPISVGLQWQRKGPPARDTQQADALTAAPPPPAPAKGTSRPSSAATARAPSEPVIAVSGGGPSWGDPADPPPGLPTVAAAPSPSTGSLSRAALARAPETPTEPVRMRDEPVVIDRSGGGSGDASSWSYATGALALAGAAGYGALTYWGRKDNQQLSECKPNCSQASLDHIKKLYLGANISAGIGAAALASWVYVTFIASPSPSPREEASRTRGYAIGLQPLPAGGLAAVSGSF